MKKWLPALVLLAAAMVYLGAIFFPITGLPHSRAESLQWDGGLRLHHLIHGAHHRVL